MSKPSIPGAMAEKTRQRIDGEYALSVEEIREFHEKGFLGPFELRSPEEMEAVRAHIDDHVLTSPGPWKKEEASEAIWEGFPDETRGIDRHRDCTVVNDLVTDPRITQRMASLYGENLLLLYSRFFNKGPGGKEIPWHQDYGFFGLQPTLMMSAWIAIDRVTTENACIQIVPGVTHANIDHEFLEDEDDEMLFKAGASPEKIDTDEVVEMELEPGEFFLFQEKTVHRSDRNRSDRRRLGLNMRAIPPWVHLDPTGVHRERPKLMRLHGEDTGLHQTVSPPTTCLHRTDGE